MNSEHPVISAFQSAAEQVPAYRSILDRSGTDPAGIHSLDDFRRDVPIIDKAQTFGSFPVAQLCRNGQIGKPTGVLTSSGHSGLFAFGIYDPDSAQGEIDRIDDALDMLFNVRSKATLLINCLPMGVQVHTRACTLAQISVRADMATALVNQFAEHYEQIIMIGEAAFIKHVLELGQSQGIDWRKLLVQIIVGEEPLAENARKYLQDIVGIDINQPETGFVGSSMGVAELGLNLFSELPELIALRRFLHENPVYRKAIFGESSNNTPMLFAYDPRRVFVEILEGGDMVLSVLDTNCPIPLIRYRTGDMASALSREIITKISPAMAQATSAMGELPIVAVEGRGEARSSGGVSVYPEEVKEGIYHNPELARMTTANFRLRSGREQGLLRIQLSPGVVAEAGLEEKFSEAISNYVMAPLKVECEPYETFKGGMTLDYERKFAYIEKDTD